MADGETKINASSILNSISHAIKKLNGLGRGETVILYDETLLNKAIQEQNEKHKSMQTIAQQLVN
jgi:hypothetical protein